MEELTAIKRFAKITSVPIMKDDGVNFICEYIKEHNVKTVLEIGTGIGYSSIKFAQSDDNVFIYTIEFDIDRYQQAVKNISDNQWLHLFQF